MKGEVPERLAGGVGWGGGYKGGWGGQGGWVKWSVDQGLRLSGGECGGQGGWVWWMRYG